MISFHHENRGMDIRVGMILLQAESADRAKEGGVQRVFSEHSGDIQ
jgi:hypothetical protein